MTEYSRAGDVYFPMSYKAFDELRRDLGRLIGHEACRCWATAAVCNTYPRGGMPAPRAVGLSAADWYRMAFASLTLT